MIDKNINKKERRNQKRFLIREKKVMKNTKFKVEDVFGEIMSNDSISPEQITKLKYFPAKIF